MSSGMTRMMFGFEAADAASALRSRENRQRRRFMGRSTRQSLASHRRAGETLPSGEEQRGDERVTGGAGEHRGAHAKELNRLRDHHPGEGHHAEVTHRGD